MGKTTRYRQRANRYGFTINNPFITEDIKVLDINNLNDEQKELLGKTKHDYSLIKQPEFKKYFNFAVIEYDHKDNMEVIGKVVAERVFFKDYISAQEFFKQIDYIDYFCFQYEQGASGNKHLQGFMHFNRPMDFKVVLELFPTMHLDKCSGKNYDCRAYCMKEETKIEGFDFYEHGVLIEERQRTDIMSFKEDLINKATIAELFEKYPTLTLNSFNKITGLQQELLKEEYKNKERELHITYIYGTAGAGKTTYPTRVLKLKHMEICKIADYGSGKFDEYQNQDIILFDEFYGQISLTSMNDILDGQPRYLPARYNNKVACYTKAFVISNYPLEKQYTSERLKGKEPSFEGFIRRMNEVIYMPNRNVYIWQKGEPSEQVKKTLAEQGATVEIKAVKIYE